ncbi:hypothetical protein I7I51_07644 [Histoplasma capsulatum]|uniref:Uncharacterized protein n=1 Tax=Ajellomyces capsulatus TaxID=5037 RepID=A0A8A1LWR6_AJECA|nr:hypothetical protein I7I51_07644 [Histoplasma capsulatum]
MPPISMSDDAKKHLDALAGWFITSKTSQVNENAEKCADDERHARLEPFLRKMGLYKKGYRHVLWRLSGRTTISKDSGFDNIFFPLSNAIDISGDHLHPGQYMRISSSQTFEAALDLLIVMIPETDNL